MPLTDQEIEVIKSAIESGDYQNNELLTPLKGLGLVMRSATDEETFTTNLKSQIVGQEDLPAYRNIETKIAELTGQKKNDGEKATEFLTRVVKPIKEGYESAQAELQTLRDKPGEASAEDKNRIKALEKMIEDTKTDYETKLGNAQKQLVDFKVQGTLDAAIAQVRAMDLDVADAVKNDVFDARLNRFKSKVGIQLDAEGNAIPVNPDGTPILDKTTLKPRAISDLLKEEFTDIVKKAEPEKKGTGATGSSAAGADANVDLTGYKTKVELTTALQKAGYTSTSKEFGELFVAAQTKYKETHGTDMPLRG